jgi:hypothetical protein
MGASPAVTACSLTISLHEPFGSDNLVRAAEDLAGGEDYGYFDSESGDAGSNPAAGITPV